MRQLVLLAGAWAGAVGWAAFARGAGPAAEPARVEVSGRLLDFNGQTEVPVGLFGLHADAKLTPERAADWGIEAFRQIHYIPGSGTIVLDRQGQPQAPFKDMPVVIDCQGDRFVPALVLTNPNYASHFDRIGRQYAQRMKDLGRPAYAEFWNEPYLNWAERSRKNYDPKYYDVAKAADDGPVTIKGWSEPLKHLRWRRLWARGPDGKIAHLVPVPKGAKPGDTFTHRLGYYFTPRDELSYTVVEQWDVYDPTAPGFWSGKQNYEFYMWMFLPWAKAIKEVHPAVQVLAGWDCPLSMGGWDVWENLTRPLIDEAHPWLDGITEHHYGLDTRLNTGTYEVVVAYAMSEHGKRLRCYNTETAGCVDPAVPGGRHSSATPLGAFAYGLRDIVELIYRCPEKAGSRTAHGSLAPGWGGGGDEFLFKLLKDFRGRLVRGASDDRSVWPVASVNGSNLVIVLFNDHPVPRRIGLAVEAPRGTALGPGRKVWVEASEPKGPLAFHEEPVAAGGRRFEAALDLPVKSGVKLVFPLLGRPPEAAEIERRQFFSKGVLRKVESARPAAFAVRVDEAMLARAGAAWVRAVLEGTQAGGGGQVRVNGTSIRLPDYDWTCDLPLDPKALKGETAVVFEADAEGRGYRVDAASLILEAPKKPGG